MRNNTKRINGNTIGGGKKGDGEDNSGGKGLEVLDLVASTSY